MSKVVFFGNEQLAQGLRNETTPLFDGLLSSGYEISALVLPKELKIISRKSYELQIIQSAKDNNIPILYADKINLEKELFKLKADVGVLVSYGRIIRQNIIDTFPHGIINIHPSLLPKYRGPTPIESTILNGDSVAGVSLMSLVSEMDAGPIYCQKRLPLNGNENKNELSKKLIDLGKDMLLHDLPDILNGNLKAHKQSNINVSYTQKITKTNGDLDPNTMSADICERKVRAFIGFPKTRIIFLNKLITVTKSHVEEHESEFGIKCIGDKWFVIDELIPQNGKKMSIKSYINGVHTKGLLS